ncbi:CDP-alcohol phosphatidyltransferase family protein [Auraticoccus monumenti]|uniref:CDP-diacylglycerol--glycerol-3-phosphate 3-phosphatidyltransferase n=1 Tax=Auraticoccus monumenti TaxID=675864 RepID=A0A1G6U258_9ACTN|nr:CDP-alcohol phosphatidyltransferase family protein [Auraticoccus monumenti]SDD35470.1 CDP-diacylglycerol--glycerol-3-phosphate 3-phosphatidyltransferase [Auraticoccus monumenti]
MAEPDVHSPAPSGVVPEHRGWGTVPNLITLVRLVVCVPLICWLVLGTDERAWTAVALVVFGATDWVDGYLARRTHTVSDVGIWLDPLADRLGITLILLAMTVAGLVPWWMLGTVLVVDAVVFLAGLVWRSRMALMRASWAGKARTALIMVALPALLLGDSTLPVAGALALVGLLCFGLGAVLHALAGVGYVLRLAGRRGEELTAGTPLL